MDNVEQKINRLNPKIELSPSKLAQRLLEILPKRSGNKILEIGAKEANLQGEHIGDDCIYLAKEGNKVTLIENGESILKRIYSKAEEEKVDSNIDFVNGKAEKLDLLESEFDAAFSLSGLDGTILPKSLKEIGRVLKPKGKALFFIYYKSGGKLMQGPEEKLEEYISDAGLSVDSKFIRVIDSEKGLEAIIYELQK
jgi:ubiquinone/menaquinone biosynthesis C-methylase UbiE